MAGGACAILILVCGVAYFGVIVPVKTYISPQAFPIEHVPVSLEAEQRVLARATAFFRGGSSDTLVLNSEDVNHLVRTSKVVADYGVRYLIELQDSLFNIKCSAPVSAIRTHMSGLINFLKLDGFINAEIEGYLRMREGRIEIITTRSQMGGREAPFTLLGARTHQDVGDFILDREQYDAAVVKLQSVFIRTEKLVFIRK
jgi:hypothetical protein